MDEENENADGQQQEECITYPKLLELPAPPLGAQSVNLGVRCPALTSRSLGKQREGTQEDLRLRGCAH